jgi:16S rRNA (uracil1498-N3)-methyltransferase
MVIPGEKRPSWARGEGIWMTGPPNEDGPGRVLPLGGGSRTILSMCPPQGDHRSPQRRFLVEVPPENQGEALPRLVEEDLRQALGDLRLQPGDTFDGLDGRGRVWPLRVLAAGRNSLELAPEGEPWTVPPPGDEGAALPSIEIAVAFPVPSLAEEMVGRLTQLGVARIRPLITERRATGASDPKLPKLERIAREACKQVGREWFPDILHPVTLSEWLIQLDKPATHLEAGGETELSEWAEGREPHASLALAVGPEGGWSDDERTALHRACVGATRLAPHNRPTKTAAEAGAAILVQRLVRDI